MDIPIKVLNFSLSFLHIKYSNRTLISMLLLFRWAGCRMNIGSQNFTNFYLLSMFKTKQPPKKKIMISLKWWHIGIFAFPTWKIQSSLSNEAWSNVFSTAIASNFIIDETLHSPVLKSAYLIIWDREWTKNHLTITLTLLKLKTNMGKCIWKYM